MGCQAQPLPMASPHALSSWANLRILPIWQLDVKSKYLKGGLVSCKGTCLLCPSLWHYRCHLCHSDMPLRFKGKEHRPTSWSKKCHSYTAKEILICRMGEIIATIFVKYSLPKHIPKWCCFRYPEIGKTYTILNLSSHSFAAAPWRFESVRISKLQSASGGDCKSSYQ